ncbi:hypothetical protein [Sorangium sp. So ce542]|uniref:hypothetical protein n=1 Tax=Sorangium sp. So ce542 TaxID=3133316 RepID=UPI003F5F92E9
MQRILCSVAILSALSSSASAPALAQDLAAAEELFNRGLADMQAGQFETGCPALAESQRLDPRAGTLFTLAECEAKWGRIATAVARYEDYLRLFARLSPDQQARQLGREKIASAQKKALAPDVPLLTLLLPASAPKETRVMRNNVELARPSLGVALPIDPGEHAIVVQPPDAPATEQRVSIGKGERVVIELKVDVPTTEAPASLKTPDPPKAPPSPPPAPLPRSDRGTSGLRVGAYVAGGLGIAGLLAGGVTGAMAFSRKGDIKDNCTGIDCNKTGKAAADSAQALGNVSTAAFGVGAAALATGVVLLLLEPSPPSRGAGSMKVLSVGMLNEGSLGTFVCLKGTW